MLFRRILDSRTLTTGDTMDLADAVDLGEFTILEIIITVLTAAEGESPQLLLQHAPSNEEDAYLDFETALAVDLTATGKTWRHIDAFTRFLGWSTSGTFTTDAVVTVDVVAKR